MSATNVENRPCVVVLGMSRSGTSTMTEVINVLGVPLGRPDDLFSGPDNPRGNFESNELCLVNDFILARFGGTWWAPPKLMGKWYLSRTANSLLPYLRTAFSDVYHSEYWLWKDPRLCYTLPLWLRVLPPVCAVVVVRNPRFVADSIHRRYQLPLAYCHALWNVANRNALRAVGGLPSVFVNFDEVLEEPVRSVERLADQLICLGVTLDGSRSEATRCLLPENRSDPTKSWADRLNDRLWHQLSTVAPMSADLHRFSSLARRSLWAETAVTLGRWWGQRPGILGARAEP